MIRLGLRLGLSYNGRGEPNSITITGVPTISGTAAVGQTLTGGDGTATGTGTTAVASRQWRRDGAVISGATSSTYTLVSADAGTDITFQVVWSDDNGSLAATSLATSIPAGASGIGAMAIGSTFEVA